MASAAAQVFGIVELLEPILFDLGTEDLVRFQRVNRLWRLVIRESPRFREALFLKSQSDYNETQYHLGKCRGMIQDNSFYFPEFYLNPFLIGAFPDSEGTLVFISKGFIDCNYYFQNIQDNKANAHKQFKCVQKKCPQKIDLLSQTAVDIREMYVTQPPCSLVRLSVLHHRPYPHEDWVSNQSGVTMGQILDKISKVKRGIHEAEKPAVFHWRIQFIRSSPIAPFPFC